MDDGLTRFQPIIHLELARTRIFKTTNFRFFFKFSLTGQRFYAGNTAVNLRIVQEYYSAFTKDASCTRNKAFMGWKFTRFDNRTGRC